MWFVLDAKRPGAIKGALSHAAAILIQETWGGTALIHEAKTLVELKQKVPEYFLFIKEQIALAPVPAWKPSGNLKLRERVHARKAELFDHLNRDAKRRIYYDFKARRELNERKRLQREFNAREVRKKEREAAAKALFLAEITASKAREMNNEED